MGDRRQLMTEEKLITAEFLHGTTGHGFAQIAESKNKLIKILWIIVLIMAFFACLIHCGLQLSRYLSFSVQTQMDYEFSNEFIYPDITLCSLQKLTTHVPSTLLFFSNATQVILPSYLAATIKPLSKISFNSTPDLMQYQTYSVVNIFDLLNTFYSTIVNGTAEFISNELKQSSSFSLSKPTFLPWLDDWSLLRLSWSHLLKCRFREELCNETRDLYSFYDPQMGHCIRYSMQNPLFRLLNNRKLLLDLRILHFLDGPNGNDDVLLLNMDEATKRIYGGYYVIHEPGTIPQMSTGSSIYNAFCQSQLLRMEKSKLINTPANPCNENPTWEYLVQADGRIEKFKSTKSLCINIISQQFINQTCSCLSNNYYIPASLKGIPYCHILSLTSMLTTMARMNNNNNSINSTNLFIEENADFIKRISCHAKAMKFLENNAKDFFQNCLDNCETLTYSKVEVGESLEVLGTNSVTKTYNDNMLDYFDSIIKLYNKSVALNKTLKPLELILAEADFRVKYAFASANLYSSAQFAVFFSRLKIAPLDLMTKITSQFFSYKLENFLSDIGGILGLWLGFSIITIIEIVEFVCLLLHAKLTG